MRTMKKIIFPLLILLFGCSDKNSESKKHAAEVEKNWIEFDTKDAIPELLILTLKQLRDNDFQIANPNENFNKTDVIIDDLLPSRQLRLLAKKNDFWRISYIQGGIGKHYVYAECKITNDSISDFKITETLLKVENNDSIDKYLANNKLVPIEVKIRME